MATLEALKKLAKKVCSTASDTTLATFDTVDEVINYIATNFDGGVATASAQSESKPASQTFKIT